MSKQVLFEAMAWTRGPEEGRESEKGQNENLGWNGIKETGEGKVRGGKREVSAPLRGKGFRELNKTKTLTFERYICVCYYPTCFSCSVIGPCHLEGKA